MKYSLMVFIVLSGCINKSSDRVSSWVSRYHDIEISYKSPWSLMSPSIDTEEKTLLVIMDSKDGASYIIKATNDIYQDQLTNEEYYKYIENAMLNEDSRNKLLKDEDKYFHGRKFHHQIYLLYTKKWGVMKQHALVLRDDNKMYSVQISYPVKENDFNLNNEPKKIKQLDSSVKILGK